MNLDHIVSSTASYYSAKLEAHGPTAQGVDWNSPDSQALRFAQLLQVCNTQEPLTLNDYGCGYGALVAFMHEQGLHVDYCGFDIAPAMIARATALYGRQDAVRFVGAESDLPVADYTVASGVFNVKQDTPDTAWEAYVLHTIERLNALSTRGFAFNVLTSYADPERKRPDLYYADPLRLFDYCKRHFSPRVALLHDYPLYEFTILVRK